MYLDVSYNRTPRMHYMKKSKTILLTTLFNADEMVCSAQQGHIAEQPGTINARDTSGRRYEPKRGFWGRIVHVFDRHNINHNPGGNGGGFGHGGHSHGHGGG